MRPYEVDNLFAEMELMLTKSWQRNAKKHAADCAAEGFEWEAWQLAKLQDLKDYKKEVKRTVDKTTRQAKHLASQDLWDSYKGGVEKVNAVTGNVNRDVCTFGALNRRKVDALIDAIHNDYDKAGQAALRLVNDQYKSIIFKSQLMFNAGAGSLEQAIDMASKDFLANGINCIKYKNGAKVNIASYAEATLRASAKKAYFTGEGARMTELNESLVMVSSYGSCSETCLPWQGRVYVDDVYCGATPPPNTTYPKLSEAMAEGLYHPNCRHTHSVFIEGITPKPKKVDPEKLRQTKENAKAQERQRTIERNIRKWKRTEAGACDPVNKARAHAKVRQWQGNMRKHLNDNPQLRRNYRREKTYGIPNNPDKVSLLKAEKSKNAILQVPKDFGKIDITKHKEKLVQGTYRPDKLNSTDNKYFIGANKSILNNPDYVLTEAEYNRAKKKYDALSTTDKDILAKQIASCPDDRRKSSPIKRAQAVDQVYSMNMPVADEMYRKNQVALLENPQFGGIWDTSRNTAFFHPGEGTVTSSMAVDLAGEGRVRHPMSILMHELGHACDYTIMPGVRLSKDKAFRSAILEDYKDLLAETMENVLSRHNKSISDINLNREALLQQTLNDIAKDLRRNYPKEDGISDIISGLSLNEANVKFAHNTSYWTRSSWSAEIASEAFANINSAHFNMESTEAMKKFFPRAWDVHEKLTEVSLMRYLANL